MKRTPNSSRVLAFLEARPHSRAELRDGTGLDVSAMKHALCSLKRHGLAITIDGKPVVYEITQKGLYWLHPKTDPERQARKERARKKKQAYNNEYRKAKRRAVKVVKEASIEKPVDDFPVERRIVPAPRIDDGLVATAIRCRPALQAVFP